MEIRNADPVVACEKIKCATDQRFSCYDREEEAIGLNNYATKTTVGILWVEGIIIVHGSWLRVKG